MWTRCIICGGDFKTSNPEQNRCKICENLEDETANIESL